MSDENKNETRDPKEPVVTVPPPAMGPNVTGDDDQASVAHQREAAPEVAPTHDEGEEG